MPPLITEYLQKNDLEMSCRTCIQLRRAPSRNRPFQHSAPFVASATIFAIGIGCELQSARVPVLVPQVHRCWHHGEFKAFGSARFDLKGHAELLFGRPTDREWPRIEAGFRFERGIARNIQAVAPEDLSILDPQKIGRNRCARVTNGGFSPGLSTIPQ
jgi:hypothetical protein